MSIGTLLAYSIVALCVIVLRYQEEEEVSHGNELPASKEPIIRQIFNLPYLKQPNSLSSNISKISLVTFCFCTMIACILIDVDRARYASANIFLSIIVVIMLMLVLIIARQPESECDLNFKVPFVPFIPLLSIFLNIFLMFQLDIHTWIRFIIWLIIGYLIFFTYGIRSSIEGNREKLEFSENGIEGKRAMPFSGMNNSHSNNGFVGDSTINLHKI